MSTMSILRNAANSRCLIRFGHQNQGLSSLLRDSPRSFSTEAERPSPENSHSDAFLRTPNTGLVYGKLLGITKYTAKTDIVNLLEGCKVGLNDIKVDYNRSFAPMGMIIQFPSFYAYDSAVRVIGRKGRLYWLERADRYQWDLVSPYDGKAVLLQGIPRNASQDDIERFLCGCSYDASTTQVFYRPAFPDPVRMALVHFPSKTQAMHAFLTRNRGFCLNNQILVQVLQ